MAAPTTAMSHYEKMRHYAPTPNLDKANPIQRYLHKGQLEPWDYVPLVLIVVIYFVFRPKIEAAMRWYFNADPAKTSQDARQAAKAAKAKVSPNNIRAGKGEPEADANANDSTTTASATTSGRQDAFGEEIKLRRYGEGGSEFTAKSFEQQLLDWDDVEEIKPVEGPKGDVTEWVDKWDGLE